MGTEQSGYLGFKFASPLKDAEVLQKAREAAINFISDEIKMSMKKDNSPTLILP